MLRRSKTERNARGGSEGAERVLVVDDLPEAGRLLGKIVRRAGYEVAELTDGQAVVGALIDEPRAVGAVVASFTTAGTRAGLRLLDAIRSHEDERIAQIRVLLILDQPRQQIFCFQAGADAILLRPFHAAELEREVMDTLARPDHERPNYRAACIDRLQRSISHPLDPRAPSATAAAGH